MEILILIFLLIILILLLKDKVMINRVVRNQVKKHEFNDPKDIMGKSKAIERPTVPNEDTKSQTTEAIDKGNNFGTGTKTKDSEHASPVENSAEDSEEDVDFEEEEEEFKKRGLSTERRGYAKGVTFEELATLRQSRNRLDPASRRRAVVLVNKIQGTELFHLFESSLTGASRRIADHLNRDLPEEPESRNTWNSDDFDIGKFV